MPRMPEKHHFITCQPLEIPGQPGRKLTATLYNSPTRRTGRRVIVHEGEAVVFDTGNCYDCANALSGLQNWVLDEQICTVCGTKGLTDCHGQDAESGLPICEACCEKAVSGPQTASMSEEDLAVSLATLAGVKQHKPEAEPALAVAEVPNDDEYPAEFPF